jgi:hypothetical protein
MKDYLIKYSGYFFILGIIIVGMRIFGIEHRRLDALPVWGQYAFGVIFFLVGLYGKKLKTEELG